MTTLICHLRSLKTASGTPLLVSRGDLTRKDTEQVLASREPYAVVYGIPDTITGEFYGGVRERTMQFDVLLKQGPDENGDRQNATDMFRLFELIAEAPEHVDELIPGAALSERLVLVRAPPPEGKFRQPEHLETTLTFECVYQTVR